MALNTCCKPLKWLEESRDTSVLNMNSWLKSKLPVATIRLNLEKNNSGKELFYKVQFLLLCPISGKKYLRMKKGKRHSVQDNLT